MNRREFFKALLGAGAACVLPGVASAAPEAKQIPSVLTIDTPLTELTGKQLEWLRKKSAESNCFSNASIRTACVPPAKPLIWGGGPIHINSLPTPDDAIAVLLRTSKTPPGTFPGIDIFID